MSNEGHRYQALERMLRRGAGAPHAPAAADACVDPETLAAWSSGALPRAEAARIEEHLADCARCQPLLAAFARTEPAAAAPAPLWKRVQIRWLVPLATAATVAAIWVALPQRQERASAPDESVARFEAPAAVPPPAAPPAASTPAAPPLVDTGRPGSREVSPLEPQPAPAPPAPQAETAAPPQREIGIAPRETDAAAERKERAVQNPQVAADAAAAPAPPAPPAASAPASPRPTAQPQQAPASLAESVINSESRQAFAKVAGVEFASPAGNTRWRIVNGRIERSTTRGKSWEAMALPSAAVINAGHAPLDRVAWFVGRAGAVFVTTDGGTIEPVPFPERVDLASVTAASERQASVTTAAGRIYRTTDGGETWMPQ